MNAMGLNSIFMISSASHWDIQEVKRMAVAHLQNYPADIYWFGSTAKGTANRYSDIDVAVLPHESLPIGLLAELRENLEQSHVIYRVDIVDLSEASDKLRERVIQEGIKWSD